MARQAGKVERDTSGSLLLQARTRPDAPRPGAPRGGAETSGMTGRRGRRLVLGSRGVEGDLLWWV